MTKEQGYVLGVEMFMLKQGMTKKKPKLKILIDYCRFKEIECNVSNEDDIELVCTKIQENWKEFRDWFTKTYIV